MTDKRVPFVENVAPFAPGELTFEIGGQPLTFDGVEYVIDFDKLKTFEEVIAALKAANLRFYSPQMSGYIWLMPWLKKVED